MNLTADAILDMQAGPEMDQLVGEAIGAEPEIFWAIANAEGSSSYDIRGTKEQAEAALAKSPWLLRLGAQILPLKKYHLYSKYMNATWEILNKFPPNQWEFFLERSDNQWVASLYGLKDNKAHVYAYGPDAQTAICRAALLATLA